MVKKKVVFLFGILILFSLTTISSEEFAYNILSDEDFMSVYGDSATGDFSFNGLCLDGGIELRSDGTICATRLEIFNITSVNVTKQNITILENLISLGNITLGFGDLVSEQNPDGADAIRLKGTSSDVDVVLGHGTGYFSVYNALDNNAVFYVNNLGNTDIAGDLTVDTSTLFVDAGNDRVGIGTASPARLLQLNAQTNTYLKLTNIDNGIGTSDGLEVSMHGVDAYLWNYEAGDLNFGTSATNRMFIQSDGNVGIGTDSPDSAFQIKANIAGSVGSHSAGQIIIQNPADTVFANVVITGYESDADGNPDQQLWYLGSSSSGSSDIIFLNRRNAKLMLGTSSSTRMTILGNGNVGIGTTSPTHELNVVGNANITGNLTLGEKITFAFGEIIDNIVNGWITITGNLNVTGNITAENVFIPQYVYSHTNATINITGSSVWTNITFDQEPSEVIYGIVHNGSNSTNTTFTFVQDGVYEIDYNFDVEDTSASSTDIDVAGRVIYINATEVLGSVFETDITKKGSEVELSHDFLAVFRAGNQIKFQFVADDPNVVISTHGTFGDHPESASVVIKKVANL